MGGPVSSVPETDKYLRELRSTGLGGSDAQHYMEAHPYGCRRRLMYAYRGAEPDCAPGSDFTRHTTEGSMLEPLIRDEWARRTGRTLSTPGTFRRQDKPYLFVNIDGEIDPVLEHDGPGVLEIKSLSRWSFDRFLAEGLYAGYLRQMQHALMVTGYKWGAFAVHMRLDASPVSGATRSLTEPMSEQQIVTFDVARNEQWIAEQESVCDAVWAELVSGADMPRKPEFGSACKGCQWRRACWEIPPDVHGSAEWSELLHLYEQSRDIAARMSKLRKKIGMYRDTFGVEVPQHPAMRNMSSSQKDSDFSA